MKKFLCLHLTAFLLFFVSCQEENLNPVLPETATEIGLSRSDAELLSLTKDSKQKGNTAEETVLSLLPNYSHRKVIVVKLLYSAGYPIEQIVIIIKKLFRYNIDEAYRLLTAALGNSLEEEYTEAVIKIYKDFLTTNLEMLKYYIQKIRSLKKQLICLTDYYKMPIDKAAEILKEFKYSAVELASAVKELYNYDVFRQLFFY